MTNRTVKAWALVTKRGALDLSGEGYHVGPTRTDFNSSWYGEDSYGQRKLVRVTITYDDGNKEKSK